MKRRSLLRTATATGAAAFAALGTGSSRAQAFPARPVRILTPFPAGAGPDAALRLISKSLSKLWNDPVIVDNKPGGNGFVAVTSFKQGGSDGHDLIELDNTHVTTHPQIFASVPYAVGDFAPLAMILRTWFFVAVAADSPYRTLDDILAAARAAPGKINYGSWFVGSPGHLGGLRLQALTGTQMTHVPYRDFGQLYTAVGNRELDWAFGSVASAGSMERSGRIRFIALAAPTRDGLYPAVPTTDEIASVRGFQVQGWVGLFAPSAAPAAVCDRIAADVTSVLATPAVRDKYAALGFEVPAVTRQAFAALIKAETESWAPIIAAARVRVD